MDSNLGYSTAPRTPGTSTQTELQGKIVHPGLRWQAVPHGSAMAGAGDSSGELPPSARNGGTYLLTWIDVHGGVLQSRHLDSECCKETAESWLGLRTLHLLLFHMGTSNVRETLRVLRAAAWLWRRASRAQGHQ